MQGRTATPRGWRTEGALGRRGESNMRGGYGYGIGGTVIVVLLVLLLLYLLGVI